MKPTKLRLALPLLLFLSLAPIASAFYDSTLGRWINRDPIEEDGGMNLYAYVQNHPTTEIDSLGLSGAPGGAGSVGIANAANAEGIAFGLGFDSVAAMRAAERAAALAAALAAAKCKKDRCMKEWEDARKKCAEELAKPNPDPVYRPRKAPPSWNVEDCARGHVSEECGGNPISHPEKKKRRRWIFE